MRAAQRSTSAHFGAGNAQKIVAARAAARTYAIALAALAAILALLAAISPPANRLYGGGAESAARGLHAAGGRTFARPLPAALAAAASSRIGSSSQAFWPVRDRGSLLTRGGGLASSYSAAGARATSPSGTLELSLASLARGARSAAVAPASPAAEGSQVVYRRGTVTERYQAGPYGLEQSFIVSKSPLRGAGALTLAIRLGGDERAQAQGAQVVFHGRGRAQGLLYGALSARDSAGRTLPARLGLRGGALQLVIDDRHARYPIFIDPFLQQGSKLTGGVEESGAGEFGSSVSLSSDGNTALVGAPDDSSETGAAWVFVRSGTTWEQQGAKLTGGEESGKARFGFRVALSGDGNTALVGGPVDAASVGAAWVFTRSEGKWTQQGPKLTGGTEESGSGEFGIGVALSGTEGNTAFVGASADNGGIGAGWVFTRSEGKWTHQGAKLTGTGEVGSAHLGFNVSLSGDGNTALAGGGGDNSSAGAAWVFTRSGEVWTQQGAKLTGTGEVGAAHVGFSVALSAEGNTAILGGLADSGEVGAAWVFTRAGEVWTQQGSKLTASGEVGKGLFGGSVSINSAGNLAVIGAAKDNLSVGAAWVFRRPAATWEQLGSKLTGSGETGKGRFGNAAAISADASTALFGGNADAESAGAAWPFANVPLAPTVVTGSASALTQNSATLNATVNPNGEEVTDCHFNYGTTIAYGHSAPCATSPGSGASPVSVSAAVGELSANSVYHFQIVATNGTGTSEGADQTFATKNPPEYGRCVKLPVGVKGQFSTAACTTAATAEKFSFEWEPGPGPKHKFTQKFKELTTVVLETVTKKAVKCSGQTAVGEYTSAKSVGNVVMTLTGCEFNAAKCASAGAAEGEVTTNALEGVLGLEKTGTKGLTSNKIALDLGPVVPGGALMEFTCGTSTVSIKGSVLVPTATNKMLASATVKFAQTSGKQKPEKLEGMPKDVLEASIEGGAVEQMGLGLTTIQTNEEKIEVNTVV